MQAQVDHIVIITPCSIFLFLIQLLDQVFFFWSVEFTHPITQL